MKMHGFQKAREFLAKTFFVPAVSDSGVLIRFVEIDNWFRVMIEIGEDTTSDDLRSAIPLALLWRDKLLESQGPWMRGGDNPFLEELSNRQESGQSYNELANRINQRVAAYLQEFADYLKEFESIKHSFETMLDFYTWQPKNNQFSYDHARGLLKALRLKDAEIEEMLKIGLENVQAGKPAFEVGYPVSREKLITTLRTGVEELSIKSSRKSRLIRLQVKRYDLVKISPVLAILRLDWAAYDEPQVRRFVLDGGNIIWIKYDIVWPPLLFSRWCLWP